MKGSIREGFFTTLESYQARNPAASARKPSVTLQDLTHGWLVKIMVPVWVPTIIRHLLFRVATKGP